MPFPEMGKTAGKTGLGGGRGVIRNWVLDTLFGMSVRHPSGGAEKAVGDRSLVSKKSPSQDIYWGSSHRLYLKP